MLFCRPRVVLAVASVASSLGVSSCGGGADAGVEPDLQAVASVVVSPNGGALAVGQTLQLTATPRNAQGTTLLGRLVVWASTDLGVASVSSIGLVTGVASGTAIISATSEGVAGTVTATVGVPVSQVSVSPSSGFLAVGVTEQLAATTKDAAGNVLTDRPLSWTSSDASVAAVSSTGLVSGVGPGIAAIIVTSEARTATASFTVGAVQRTYVSGRDLVMERSAGREIVHLHLDSAWGGLIVEASVNGLNAMDRNDPGRGVGLSFQDSTDVANPSALRHFNPVQGGDSLRHGSPILRQELRPSSILVETQPVQWNAVLWGGSASMPALSDIKVEQTVTPVASDVHAFRIHYKVTHLGNDTHGVGYPEFPCLYVLKGFDRLMTYMGDNPWTGAAASHVSPPVGRTEGPTQNGFVRTLEKWVAYVNASDYGVSLWVPAAYPSYTMRDFVVTNYAAPSPGPLALGPGVVVEGDAFLYVGDYKKARQLYGSIRNTEAANARDPLVPMMNLESPKNGATVSATVLVSGWAFDNVAAPRVEVLVDGLLVGAATYGMPRPDVDDAFHYGSTSLLSGFSYSLDTRTLTPGPHQITARVIDGSQNTRIQTVTVQIPYGAEGRVSERLPRGRRLARLGADSTHP